MQARPSTGTSLKRALVKGDLIPFDKEWKDLSRDQQDAIRSEYDNLAPTDEPPYPLGGSRVVYEPIGQAYRHAGFDIGRGQLMLVVNVGEDGRGRKVDVYESVDHPRFIGFVANVLMQTRYKPGTCQGTPCEMPYLFRLRLGSED